MTDIVHPRRRALGKRYRIGAPRAVSDAARPHRRACCARRSAGARRGRGRDRALGAARTCRSRSTRGDVVGLIGRNGAGKSTLLKILSRITEPTEGEADILGRVGSLLEVGTGFHPELTGRENIFLNGAILGMRRAEIARKFDEIVAFAEVERFIDTPVKHYSSGMYVRLAFAVAAHLEPEILIVDEVLRSATRDSSRSASARWTTWRRGGRTVLFVSHNMAAVQRLASSAHAARSRPPDVDRRAARDDREVSRGRLGVALCRRRRKRQTAGAARRHRGRIGPRREPSAEYGPGGRPLALCAASPHGRHGRRHRRALGRWMVRCSLQQHDDVAATLPREAGEHEVAVMIPSDILLAGDYHLAICLWDHARSTICRSRRSRSRSSTGRRFCITARRTEKVSSTSLHVGGRRARRSPDMSDAGAPRFVADFARHATS